MRALGFEGSREEVNAMIQHADETHENVDDGERVFKIFAGKDGTRTGYVDGSDLKREAGELGDTYPTEQWDQLVDLVTLGRGHLELEDWMRIMKNHGLY